MSLNRTRQEIVDALVEQSNADPILKSVSRSMVGKELLYFLANGIYQQELGRDAVSRHTDLSRVSKTQLLAYAYTNDLPCDMTKPAIVKVTLSGIDRVCPPFSICLQVGSLRFYNIDFVRTTHPVNLYQGYVKSTQSFDASVYSWLDAFGVDTLDGVTTRVPWQLYQEFHSGKYHSSYVKLGQHVISDSVRVFAREFVMGDQTPQIVFPYTEYNAQYSSPDAKLYKVRTGWDSSVNVLFGDENWSQVINPGLYHYQIYWLQATTANYNLTAGNLLTIGYPSALDRVVVTKDATQPVYYTVDSWTGAEVNSLAYSRSYLQTKKFLQQGLVTERQITNFVDSFDTINSHRLETTRNEVTVVLKPDDPNDDAFGFLQDYLYQYGVDGTQYRVIVATPLDFDVELTALSGDATSLLTQAVSVLNSRLSYGTLRIDEQVSSAILNQWLQQAGIFGVSAAIIVKGESVSPLSDESQKLQALPLVNTIQQYNVNGEVVGFDSDGVYNQIVGALNLPGDINIITPLGDFMFLVNKDSAGVDYVSYIIRKEDNRITAVVASSVFGELDGRFGDLYDTEIPCVTSDNHLLLFADSVIFREGGSSIFNRKSYIRATNGVGNPIRLGITSRGILFDSIADDTSIVYLNGYLYLALHSSTSPGACQVFRFFLNSATGEYESDGIVVGIGPVGFSERFTVANGNILVPTSSVTGPDYVFDGYYLFNTATGSYTVGRVIFQDGTGRTLTLKGMRFGDTSLYVLLSKTFGSSVATLSYRFSSSMDTLQCQVQQETIFANSSPYPTTMLSLNGLTFLLTDGSYIWKGSVVIPGIGNSIEDAQLFDFYGSVDYETGTIYGIHNTSITGIDTLEYYVSGTLTGGYTYPRLDEVIVK